MYLVLIEVSDSEECVDECYKEQKGGLLILNLWPSTTIMELPCRLPSTIRTLHGSMTLYFLILSFLFDTLVYSKPVLTTPDSIKSLSH